MKLHEISTEDFLRFNADDPIVLELVKKRLDNGETVVIRWTEHGHDHEADVSHVRRAASGDGYAIEYTFAGYAAASSDKIYFRAPELENAQLTKYGDVWMLDMRKDPK